VTASSRRRLLAPSLLLAAGLAAGCGGSPDSEPAGGDSAAATPAAAPVDACALFTPEDARAVAGESVAAMASTLDEAKGRNPGECIYNSGTTEQPRILGLLIRQHRSVKAARRFQKSSRSSLRAMTGGKIQDVPGLGDRALWAGGRIQQLHVLKGNRQFIITVQSPDGTDQLPRARQIAERVLQRLKAG
jgi:hypothetical protein